tara:strand:- start:143 stop:565 length:423 start_codon:yes stop_codon:yes gene_type:complete
VPANDTGYRLYEQVGYILRQVSQRHIRIFSDQITDLTPTQFAALAKLCEWRSISQNELGRQTSMDASTIKGVVDRLRNRGYLETQPDQRDHRRLILSPSAQGERVFADLVTVASDITAKTLEPLTKKEQDQFLRLLSKLK